MSLAAPLLPDNAEPFDLALDAVAARISAVPVPIGTVVQPLTVTARFLPFIAWGLSVDVWPGTGDEKAHRAAVAASLPLHMRKGTPYAIRRYIAMAGGEVTLFRRPPAIAHVGRNFRPDERAAWLAHYPELRVYPYRGRALRPRSIFAGAFYAGAKGKAQRFTVPSTAEDRTGRRAFLNDRGVEVPLKVTVVTRLEETRVAIDEEVIQLPNRRPWTFFAGQRLGRRFAGGGAQVNTVRLTHSVAYAAVKSGRQRLIVSPGLTPIDPTPVEVHGRTIAPRVKFFAGSKLRGFAGGRFLTPSTAYLRVYDTVWLYVPGRHVPPSRGRFFAGSTRLGQAPYTAEIKVRLRRDVTKRKMFAGPGQFLARKFACPTDRTRLDEVLRAVRSAAALRDEIFLDLAHTKVITADPHVYCGDVICGQQVEITR